MQVRIADHQVEPLTKAAEKNLRTPTKEVEAALKKHLTTKTTKTKKP